MTYDNTCKYLVEVYLPDFSQWFTGQSIPFSILQPTELSAEPIRADSIIFLQSASLILHIEFQTQPDPDIPLRMLDYWIRIRRRYPSHQIRQIVLYLRSTRSPLVQQTQLQDGATLHPFEVIRLWEVDPQTLLSLPGLLPFVALSESPDPIASLRTVQTQIQRIPDLTERANLFAATAVLAGLKLDQALIRQILGSELMKESVIYQAWVKEAQEQGLQQGIQQGIQQVARNLLQANMDPQAIVRLTGLTLEQIHQLQPNEGSNWDPTESI
jgi:predicted transposase/invertase (TIGR01784 family)